MLLDDSIGFLINRTGRRVSQLFALRLSPTGVTTEQWSVLARLCEEDGISQKDLAHRVGKDQTNVTRILDQLERKELIVRRVNPEDRRSYLPSVTDSGRRAYEEIAPIEENVIRLISEGIPPEQLAALKELLSRIADNASSHLNDDRPE
ncbi:MarR family winged helix-turn-helix transcriptional regulator [Cohnella fermenti]|uniref:MarR family transcriptional regulator n=1 Tax=Cohnella fermenti TaxID=2565925 RepID=A0A4S4BKH7_9BACL|nr:MarR family transcriptional regulator [Cohnella fermenti]THF75125.1 MarR family transcriptional regulator [Cohnella fermenti]